MSEDIRTFKKGEVVLLFSGGTNRSSVELAQVGEDVRYSHDKVLISIGAFNTAYSKSSVHKLPPTMRKIIKGEL
jgi:hypothetical protein